MEETFIQSQQTELPHVYFHLFTLNSNGHKAQLLRVPVDCSTCSCVCGGRNCYQKTADQKENMETNK